MTYKDLNNIVEYAKTSPDREICAALLGVDMADGNFRLKELVPIKNVAGKGVADYICDQGELLNVLMKTSLMNPASNARFIGVFHNHPYWRPHPSEMDIDGAGFAGVYIIYSNIYDDMMAWYNEGSFDSSVTYAVNDGKRGFRATEIILK